MIKQLNTKVILLLEDDQDLSSMMIPIFKVFVKTVWHAETIKQAHELMRIHNIDIIITDVHLKNENGLDFIKEIRQKNDKIPIVVLSAYKDETTLLKAIPLGLTSYLIKPVNYAQLVETFEKCIHKIISSEDHLTNLPNGFTYSIKEKIVLKGTNRFKLNKREINFIELVYKNKKQLITKEMIQHNVWEDEDMSDSALYNFIMRIRHRFGKDFIHTVSNLGYRLGE